MPIQQLVIQSNAGVNDDTYITDTNPSSNYGGAVVMTVGQDQDDNGKDVDEFEYRALLRFDVSSIASYTILSSTLTLTVPSGYFAASQSLTLYRCGQPAWTELGATWNTYDGTSIWTSGAGNPTTPSTTISFSGSSALFDTTSLVIDAIQNRGSIVNCVLDGNTFGETVLANFGSFDHTTPSSRPNLTINYLTPETASGGVELGGSADTQYTVKHSYSSDGGITLDGSATCLPSVHYVAEDGLALAGTSDALVTFFFVPIEDALWAHLISRESLVGVNIYPLHLPQNPKQNILPAISYNRITSGDEYDLSGPISYVHPRFNLHVWANTFNETKRIADNLKEELNSYAGFFEGTEILHVAIRNIGDMPVERSEGTNKVVYHRVLDCEIWHRTENGA